MAGKTVPEIYCWEIQFDELIIRLASSRKGAVRIALSLRKASDCLGYFRRLFPCCRITKNRHMTRPLIEAVEAVMNNRPPSKELPLDISGTSFQRMAWKAISRIPFGQTRTYGEVAVMIGRRGGARAVGQAMKRNPLPLIFP